MTGKDRKGLKCLLVVDYFSGFIVIGGKHVGKWGSETIKHLLQKAEDPYKLCPLHNGYSPAELLMSRHLWTTLPVVPSKLCPSLPDFHLVRKEEQAREHQMNNFDTRHRAASLEPLLLGDNVWVTDRRSWWWSSQLQDRTSSGGSSGVSPSSTDTPLPRPSK